MVQGLRVVFSPTPATLSRYAYRGAAKAAAARSRPLVSAPDCGPTFTGPAGGSCS
jgi:hypothetical protein